MKKKKNFFLHYGDVTDAISVSTLIKKIRPKVIVKGGDYNAQDVVGSDLCEVRIFDYVNGFTQRSAAKIDGTPGVA